MHDVIKHYTSPPTKFLSVCLQSLRGWWSSAGDRVWALLRTGCWRTGVGVSYVLSCCSVAGSEVYIDIIGNPVRYLHANSQQLISMPVPDFSSHFHFGRDRTSFLYHFSWQPMSNCPTSNWQFQLCWSWYFFWYACWAFTLVWVSWCNNSKRVRSQRFTKSSTAEFEMCMKTNVIKHKRSAPGHPATNGEAERFVQTFKRDGDSLQTRLSRGFLFVYRTTPHSTRGVSPEENWGPLSEKSCSGKP